MDSEEKFTSDVQRPDRRMEATSGASVVKFCWTRPQTTSSSVSVCPEIKTIGQRQDVKL